MRESSFYQEIMEEGVVNARRVDILFLIEERFSKREAASLKKPLAKIEDLTKLQNLLRLALWCTDFAELRKAISD